VIEFGEALSGNPDREKSSESIIVTVAPSTKMPVSLAVLIENVTLPASSFVARAPAPEMVNEHATSAFTKHVPPSFANEMLSKVPAPRCGTVAVAEHAVKPLLRPIVGVEPETQTGRLAIRSTLSVPDERLPVDDGVKPKVNSDGVTDSLYALKLADIPFTPESLV
jgi:hypothetical protein